jgi:outer membrane protein assembly factor BamB
MVILAPQTQQVGLVAYDKLTGKMLWKSDYIGRNWYSHVSPQPMRLCGKDQIIMLAQPSDPEKAPANAPPAIISSIDPANGNILWQTKTPGPYKIPIPQPVQISETRLLITGGYQMGCLILQASYTNNQWQTTVASHNKSVAAHIHSPVLYRGKIYVSSFKEHGGTHSGLVCLDLDGKPLWQTGPELKFDDGAMIFADGMAFVMQGKSGHLYMIDVASPSYKVLASAKILDPPSIWAPLALSDGKLVIRDQKRLLCLDLVSPND